MTVADEPIEQYLDDLLRTSRADARSTRRLLDETADHLHSTADDLTAAGMPRADAEREAVRRFGELNPLLRAAYRRSLGHLAVDATRAGLVLLGVGLTAIGVSGLVAGAMNLLFGRAFVGGPQLLASAGNHASVTEVADDAVVLRLLAGLVGVLLVAVALVLAQRRPERVLPPALLDVLAVAAFAAATLALAGASVMQSATHGVRGVGFFLSGAVVSALATAVFAVRLRRSALRPF